MLFFACFGAGMLGLRVGAKPKLRWTQWTAICVGAVLILTSSAMAFLLHLSQFVYVVTLLVGFALICYGIFSDVQWRTCGPNTKYEQISSS
jgi:hypothetical protein